MIKKIVAKISGSVGIFNKNEAIAAIGKISNFQSNKINEIIDKVNELEARLNKVEKNE